MAFQRRGAMARCVGLAAGVMFAGGCAPDSPPAPNPEPTVTVVTTSPSPSVTVSEEPSPSPSPSSTLDDEQAAAVETVLEFFRLKNELSKDPALHMQPLVNITTGETQELEMAFLTQDREDGLIQTGDDLYYVTEVKQVLERGTARVVTVHVCTDSRETDVVNQATGKSVLEADRAFFVEWDIEVLMDNSDWLVGDILSGRVQRCGP